jgi:hypothetical protein
LYLFPKVTQRSTNLTVLDIAIRRPDVAIDPTEVTGIYIQDGIAKYVTSEVTDRAVTPADWVEVRALDFAKDVSIAFNGTWQRLPDGRFRFLSIGEPWLFLVTPDGQLYTQQGDTGTQQVLCDTGVVKVDAIRAWQDLQNIDVDQGLVAAYIKADGLVYYRSYCIQATGNVLWEDEQLLPSQPAGVSMVDVKLFRTNDFRLGFILSDGLNLTLLVTERTWASMSVDTHMITSSIDNLSIAFTPVTYYEAYAGNTDKITVLPSDAIFDMLYALSSYSITSLSNPDALTILAVLNAPIGNVNVLDFKVVDGTGYVWKIETIALTTDKQTIILNMEDFNNALEGLTISFLAPGTSLGEAGQTINAFSGNFTPVGLVYVPIPLPEPILAYNEEVPT